MSEPLVKLTWLDAHGVSGTTALSLHEIPHGAIEITSYGLLLRQDDSGISIASEVCADGTYRGYTFVPAGMLLKVEPVIKVKKPRKKRVNDQTKSARDGEQGLLGADQVVGKDL